MFFHVGVSFRDMTCAGDAAGALPGVCPEFAKILSSAAASGPLGLPCASRHKARRIIAGSAPCWTAMLKVMAASRAFTSAPLFVLWLDKNSSPIRPSGNLLNVQVYLRPATSKSNVSLWRRFASRLR